MSNSPPAKRRSHTRGPPPGLANLQAQAGVLQRVFQAQLPGVEVHVGVRDGTLRVVTPENTTPDTLARFSRHLANEANRTTDCVWAARLRAYSAIVDSQAKTVRQQATGLVANGLDDHDETV